jgi:serine/threonine protein phosphatase 1
VSDRYAVVGDIHGNLTALDGLLSRIANRAETTVFVGDYINRGSDGRGVLDRLIDMSSPTIYLAGNHEVGLLRFIDGDSLQDFLQIGGAPTVRSFLPDLPPRHVAAAFRERLAGRYEDFLRSLAPYHCSVDLLVTHDQHRPDDVGADLFHVYGHTVQHNGRPTITPRHAAIDTGCGSMNDGLLTCLLWPSLEIVQVDHGGRLVTN